MSERRSKTIAIANEVNAAFMRLYHRTLEVQTTSDLFLDAMQHVMEIYWAAVPASVEEQGRWLVRLIEDEIREIDRRHP